MKNILLTMLVALCTAAIDVLPMLKIKQGKHSILSAFLFYIFLPFIIYSANPFHIDWWIKGTIITFALALPMIIYVSKDDKKAVPPMVIMSLVLGTIIGIAGDVLHIQLLY